MRISELTQRTVVTADISESLSAAASRLRLADVSALPITEEGRTVGILTERDLTRAVGTVDTSGSPARSLAAALQALMSEPTAPSESVPTAPI